MIKINGEEWSAKKLMILVPGIKESAATARLKRYKQGLCPRDYMLRPIEKNKSQNNTHHPKLVKINGEEWTTAKIIKKVPGICRSTAAK